MTQNRDPILWEIAQKRASFKRHLAVYIIVNGFLWLLWFYTGRPVDYNERLPWPLWPTLGWGIGLAFHFMGAYVFHKNLSAEKEYEKLVREKQNEV